jgi:hypothetical protein
VLAAWRLILPQSKRQTSSNCIKSESELKSHCRITMPMMTSPGRQAETSANLVGIFNFVVENFSALFSRVLNLA